MILGIYPEVGFLDQVVILFSTFWGPPSCFYIRFTIYIPTNSTVRRSNQSIPKAISPECSLEELMLTLKLQYFGHLMQRADSLEETLMLGKIEGRRRRGQQKIRWLDGITNSMDMGLGWLRSWWWIGRPGMLWFMGLQRVGHNWMTEQLNWTDANTVHKDASENKTW